MCKTATFSGTKLLEISKTATVFQMLDDPYLLRHVVYQLSISWTESERYDRKINASMYYSFMDAIASHS